jgi:RecJ-like exonuclease
LTTGRKLEKVAVMKKRPQFDQFEATELFCPRCRAAQPVRRHLLLVLPGGNKYEYRCSVCGTAVGGKDDNDSSEFAEILRRT